MTNIKVVTDSNSGITQAQAKELGIFVLPMPFLIDGEEYFEDINLTQQAFYEHLHGEAAVSTSQPSALNVTELWDELLSDGSDIVHIPMSSGLSETCHAAQNLAKNYGGRVQGVDNQRISVTLKQSALDALTLAKQGKSAEEIKTILEGMRHDSSIYIALDTLKYLKKGGRLTPAAALIGTILKIKPVLQIQGGKLDAFKKVHSLKQAKQEMIAAVRRDLSTRFKPYLEAGEMTLSIAHTDNAAEAEIFRTELEATFPEIPVSFVDPLSLSVSCHIGPGALAVTATRIAK